jgi:hypothetical protein
MSRQSHVNRDRKVIGAVPCPVCGARIGEPCRTVTRDGRPDALASRTHSDRRAAWQATDRRRP